MRVSRGMARKDVTFLKFWTIRAGGQHTEGTRLRAEEASTYALGTTEEGTQRGERGEPASPVRVCACVRSIRVGRVHMHVALSSTSSFSTHGYFI